MSTAVYLYRDRVWILNNIYINGPFWLWVHFVAPIFVITVDGQVLDRGNYIYQWSLMVHFVAPIFKIPLIHGILKVAKVDILLLYKAGKVGEIIHG